MGLGPQDHNQETLPAPYNGHHHQGGGTEDRQVHSNCLGLTKGNEALKQLGPTMSQDGGWAGGVTESPLIFLRTSAAYGHPALGIQGLA